MIVVSNTSPVTNLAAIGQLDLLRRLYGTVYIPAGVWRELNAEEKPWPGRDEVAQAGWMRQQAPANQALVMALLRDLDLGEAEAIALGLELHADLVLIDEEEGRRAARRLGLRVIGVVGILLDAKAHGMIERVQPLLDALRHAAGFYLSQSLYEHALALAGESGAA